MANELTIENCSYEVLIGSKTAQTLQKELHLTDTQVAKANLSLMSLLDDLKLSGATQLSKLRFVYKVPFENGFTEYFKDIDVSIVDKTEKRHRQRFKSSCDI